ncbi:hypothetical protein N7492_006736 [Penicillium capsulatum]|uniref:Major facilitator superfamily (MFS) profile domain-containing protein n=1 Tax=Penicillium capsulatum TaxID=69766 RepID=A0A9W9LL01_9EURO|nr:hypothetical protein N7492_006736 [Penicillium capsulatum]KAJ6116571.1 hypothetical protein N7512_006296 [Penicillium capsulatum]
MSEYLSPSERTPLVAVSRPPERRVSVSRGAGIITLMGLFTLIQSTNMSMMTTAQSSIAADLDAFAETTWFTSSYMIAMSSVTPLAGRISAIFTPRIYIVFSSTIMAIGLFITAAASTLTVFLLGRSVAGIGSGGLMSATIILALDLASSTRRGLFIGLISTGYTVGLSSGAVLAGLLAPTLGWRFLFWSQAPISLLLGPLLFFVIPTVSEDSAEEEKVSLFDQLARVDYAGSLTLVWPFLGSTSQINKIQAISVVLLLSSLASPEIIIWPISASAILFGLFLLIESRWAREPVIPVHVLRTRSVMLSCVSSLGLMMARWSVLFYTPIYAMAVRGWSPASAGLILVPTNAGFGIGGLLVGWLHIRQVGSYYMSCLTIFVLFTGATCALSFLSTPTSLTAIYLGAAFLNGLFAGALMNYTLSHLLHLTHSNVHYIVTALIGMSRGFAGSFGSAVGGGFFTRILKNSLEAGFSKHGLSPRPHLVHTLLGSPATVMHLEGLERVVAVESYEHAVRMLFIAGAGVALLSTLFQAGTGSDSAHSSNRMRDSEDANEA